MTSDLRHADVPVARMTVDRTGAATGASPDPALSSRDGGASGQDSRRDRAAPTPQDEPAAPTESSTPQRVRIVL